MSETIVEYFGKGEGSRCGYCKSESTKISHGMWAHRMSCEVYERLLDRGWRRSGKYCYKPLMDTTCCPQYTIRCNALDVKLSKSQKKVIKRFNKFIVSGKKEMASGGSNDNKVTEGNTVAGGGNIEDSQLCDAVEEMSSNICLPIENNNTSQDCVNSNNNKPEQILFSPPMAPLKQGATKGADPNKPRCRKAKEIRVENKAMKLSYKTCSNVDLLMPIKNEKVNYEKSIEDFINERVEGDSLHRLEVSLVSVTNKAEFEPLFSAEYALYCKYQTRIHGDKEEEMEERRFRRFLVDCPLKYVQPAAGKSGLPSTGFGAFHQRYFLDGKLIAVGVLDILPHCVSSKYFFYDPDYSFLSLGTYSALREIYLIRWLNKQCSNIKYYYMGYYISSCPKMKYKGQYHPSHLLCPETYRWQPVEKCVAKFTVSKYSRLDKDKCYIAGIAEVISVLILHEQQVMEYTRYMERLPDVKQVEEFEVIEEYARLVGNSCQNMLLYRAVIE